MAKEKIDKKIRENLFSQENEVAVSAIKNIKEKGNKLYIPLVFELLNSTTDDEVFTEIIKLLETVKDNKTVPGFIEAIENEEYSQIRSKILATCWQNGLDFSEYLPLFTDIVINDEWENSFEAFTIIDNLAHLPEQIVVDEVKEKINIALKDATEQKAYFLKEILVKLK